MISKNIFYINLVLLALVISIYWINPINKEMEYNIYFIFIPALILNIIGSNYDNKNKRIKRICNIVFKIFSLTSSLLVVLLTIIYFWFLNSK
jgi:hypothetical protein